MKRQQIALALGASVVATASLMAANSSERYVYDASGNIIEKQIGTEVTQFDYDGNLLKGSLLDAAQKQYQYDDAGRLVGELEKGQVVRKLNYQFADKVTEVQNNEEITELFYNAEGQLVGTNSAGNLEAFAWDGLAILSRGERAYTNEKHAAGGIPVLIGDSVTVSDFVGTTISIGKESFKCSAFGEGLEEGLFTGKPFSKELDGFVFRYRNYSSDTARWMTCDPLGYPDGSNNYSYVQGDPIHNLDPEGTLTAVGFPKNATKDEEDDVCSSNNVDVIVKAAKMTTTDFRATLVTLITAQNAGLQPSARLTPSTTGPEAGVLLPKLWEIVKWTPGAAGGAEARVSATYNGGALPGGKFHSWVQSVYTNAPLGNHPANQSYLDGAPIAYSGGEANSRDLHDTPSREYSQLKSCGGPLNQVYWVAKANTAIVDGSNKTIQLPKDAGFKYNWTLQEK